MNLTVTLNNSLDTGKIKIFLIDGPAQKSLPVKFIDRSCLIDENIKSRYARLIVMYPGKTGGVLGTCFLVNEKKAFLYFEKVEENVVDMLANYRCKNIINVKDSQVFKRINQYAKSELNDFNRISEEKGERSDRFIKLLETSYETLALKQIDFIKKNGGEYLYFEKFINEIIPPLKSKYLLELYEVFNSSFPQKFKVSYEGQSAKALLEGNLYIKVGMQSPKFKTIDFLGNEISSDKLKGKYYLLSFWATWCSPCLKEIPQIRNIRNKYNDKIAIISISRDTDYKKFLKGVEDYKMNWIHVYNMPSMENLFGEKPIPSLYLMNEDGKIVFSSWELPMDKLDEILTKALN